MNERVPQSPEPAYIARWVGGAVLSVLAAVSTVPIGNRLHDVFIKPQATPVEQLAPDQVTTYVARPGDTPWDIAERVTDRDPRSLASELARQAGDDGLQVGEELRIPNQNIDNPKEIK